jgi:transposase-like protein
MKDIYGIPCCPYCSEPQQDLSEIGDYNEGEHKYTCWNCEKALILVRTTNEELIEPREGS